MSPRWLVVFAAWAGVLAIGVANAAVLGGLTPSSLVALNQSGSSGAPTVLTCDDFSLSAVTVSVDGVLAISYTLSAGQVTTLSGGTRVGLYYDSGGAIRFTNIVATTPAAP